MIVGAHPSASCVLYLLSHSTSLRSPQDGGGALRAKERVNLDITFVSLQGTRLSEAWRRLDSCCIGHGVS